MLPVDDDMCLNCEATNPKTGGFLIGCDAFDAGNGWTRVEGGTDPSPVVVTFTTEITIRGSACERCRGNNHGIGHGHSRWCRNLCRWDVRWERTRKLETTRREAHDSHNAVRLQGLDERDRSASWF
jgi:hypothetical protein